MKKRAGFILVTAFLTIVLLLILSGIFVMSSLTEHRASQKQLAIATAFYLAEAGIEDAIVNLRADDMYSGTTPSTASLGTQGEFETRVTQPDPTNQPTIRRIESWGYTPSKDPTAYGYQMKKVEVYAEVIPIPLFEMAIFTQRNIEVQNSTIDSYDSSKGDYDPNNPGSNGDIGTNNSGVGKDGEIGQVNIIDGTGASIVNGDAVVGPTVPYWDAINLSGKSTITGIQYNLSESFDFPPVEVPDGVVNSGNLNITKGQTVLPGDTYWFSSIKISGNGSLSFSGPSTVYVTGDVDISGNGVSTSGNLPPNLIINIVGAHQVNIMGEAAFYGGIYAPESEVKVGNGVGGVVFGSILADNVKLMNATFHYDEALRKVLGGVGYTVTVLAWHESIQ